MAVSMLTDPYALIDLHRTDDTTLMQQRWTGLMTVWLKQARQQDAGELLTRVFVDSIG